MTTKNDTEQLRADFEAWHAEKYWAPLFDDELGRFIPTVVQNRWEAYQAGRAAQTSGQDREDAERIQFMADEACTFNTWKQEDGSWKYRLEWEHGTEWQTEWFSTPEEAIDHARRIEENE